MTWSQYTGIVFALSCYVLLVRTRGKIFNLDEPKARDLIPTLFLLGTLMVGTGLVFGLLFGATVSEVLTLREFAAYVHGEVVIGYSLLLYGTHRTLAELVSKFLG